MNNSMKVIIAILAVLVVLSVLLASCRAGSGEETPAEAEESETGTTTGSAPSLEAPDLQERTWNLTFYMTDQGERLNLIEGSEITARFQADGRMTGSAGCNDYSVSYELADSEISIGQFRTTTRACSQPAGVMNQEQSFYGQVLKSQVQYEVNDQQLTLLNPDGSELAVFATSD